MATATSTSAAIAFSNLASSRSTSLAGSPLPSSHSSAVAVRLAPKALSCRAQKAEHAESSSSPSSPCGVSRRAALPLLASVAAVALRTSPAEAAYGEAANIFGAAKKDSGFKPVNGDGFKLSVPSKWNPSKEREFPGTVLRYEDNFDSNTNLAVMVLPAEKSSIKDYGSPEKFLESVSYLLGKQAYSGKTVSEGGFDPNAVATAAILESSTPVINGKEYYNISVLTRTADGDEGGKHQVIVGTVSNGKLYLLKVQAGDKRWFKGTKKFVEGAASSFSVA